MISDPDTLLVHSEQQPERIVVSIVYVIPSSLTSKVV
jgi:hypothetical protein